MGKFHTSFYIITSIYSLAQLPFCASQYLNLFQWRIFDPAGPSGYIANCIVGIQRSMNPSDRLRGGGQGKLVDVDENSDATASTSTSSDNYHDPEVNK